MDADTSRSMSSQGAMVETTVIGLDVAKQTFQVHGVRRMARTHLT